MKTLKKLAVVDDDEIFIFLTERAVENTDYVEGIKVFNNGFEALYFLKENKDYIEDLPDVILLDLSMPVMDGWQFLEEFTKLNPKIGKEILIYICSSSISPDHIMKAKEISVVTDYIIKPVSKERMLEILKQITEH